MHVSTCYEYACGAALTLHQQMLLFSSIFQQLSSIVCLSEDSVLLGMRLRRWSSLTVAQDGRRESSGVFANPLPAMSEHLFRLLTKISRTDSCFQLIMNGHTDARHIPSIQSGFFPFKDYFPYVAALMHYWWTLQMSKGKNENKNRRRADPTRRGSLRFQGGARRCFDYFSSVLRFFKSNVTDVTYARLCSPPHWPNKRTSPTEQPIQQTIVVIVKA